MFLIPKIEVIKYVIGILLNNANIIQIFFFTLYLLNTIFYIISKTLHNHKLRHTRITRWKEAGMDMEAIQYLAGHVEGSEITNKVYIDVSENFAFEQLEKAL